MRRLAVLVVGIGLLLVAVPVIAHHSFSAEFDIDQPITLEAAPWPDEQYR